MSKWIIELPDDCEGNCRDCLIACPGFPDLKKEGKMAVPVKTGFDVCWGETQAYDFHSRRPVKLFAVEEE